MQKLIANYASSDEEEEVQKTDSLTQSENQKQNLPQPSRLFSKLPPPKHSKSLDNETDQKITENNSSHSSQSLQSPPEALQSSIQSTNVNNLKGSQKITFTLPIDTKKLQQKEEKEEDYLLPRYNTLLDLANLFLIYLLFLGLKKILVEQQVFFHFFQLQNIPLQKFRKRMNRQKISIRVKRNQLLKKNKLFQQ